MRQLGRIREVVTYDRDSAEWCAYLVIDGKRQPERYASHRGEAYRAIGAMRQEATKNLQEVAR